jgi:hypothetical protein
MVLGGMQSPTAPLPLNDGRYLRLTASLELQKTSEGPRLKTVQSSYQYQSDSGGRDWICRYDYLREPGDDPHPQAHLQVNGAFGEDMVSKSSLPRIHFPTGRVALEAMIRLLADQFEVPCNEPPEMWRPVLSESEQAFQRIAHQPPSGPAR